MNMLLSLNNSDWIALSSAVVALSALAVSIWQGYLARRHSVLSVMPHIDVVIDVSGKDGNDISLQNGGLGPAVVEAIDVTIDGKTTRIKTDADFQVLVNPLRAFAPDCRFSHAVPDQYTIVSAGNCLLIFRARSESHRGELGQGFNSLTEQMSVRVHYRCIYGVKYLSEYKAGRTAA